MPAGIKDKVAIIGMGCSRFGERWESNGEDLIVEAFTECLKDAGIEKNEIQAAFLGTNAPEFHVGSSALPLSTTLRLPNISVARNQNFCATGTDTFRFACYAVASGAHDICLAMGVEKLKDVGYGGLPARSGNINMDNMTVINMTPPGMFGMVANAYKAKHGLTRDELKEAIAHVTWKSHQNGAKNPKAHLRKEVSMEQIMNAPIIADPLGLFDCCGVSDGAACAIVTTPKIAKDMGKKDFVSVKALQGSLSNGYEAEYNEWLGDHILTTEKAAEKAYTEAGITNPRKEISMMEVHDCFSITELVTMEDLKISPRGGAVKDVLDGLFDLDGGVPCQVDGGLKCFGHPIGASGLRMIYAMYEQLHGRAGDRQLPDPKIGLTHNLGGFPWQNVAAVSIIGRYDS